MHVNPLVAAILHVCKYTMFIIVYQNGSTNYYTRAEEFLPFTKSDTRIDIATLLAPTHMLVLEGGVTLEQGW